MVLRGCSDGVTSVFECEGFPRVLEGWYKGLTREGVRGAYTLVTPLLDQNRPSTERLRYRSVPILLQYTSVTLL
jgi:hypothetical protein